MRALFVINPNASRAAAGLPQISAWLQERRDCHLVVPGNQREMSEAIAAFGPQAERIVIGGGDGTLSEALADLLPLGKPLAVLPLGTANDFARTLSVPNRIMAAAELALAGREHRIDVGRANGRPFLNVASVGVASKVTEAQSEARKKTFAVLSYAVSFREAIRQARPFYVHIEVNGAPYWKGMVHQVSVANGRYHGGGLIVAEDAAIDDGTLHLYVVRPGTFWQLVACVASLKLGLSGALPALKRGSASSVRLRTSKPRRVDVDGELCIETPADFSVEAKALSVIVPEKLPFGQRGLVDL